MRKYKSILSTTINIFYTNLQFCSDYDEDLCTQFSKQKGLHFIPEYNHKRVGVKDTCF